MNTALYIALSMMFAAMATWAIAAALHSRKMAKRIEADAAALRATERQVTTILTRVPIGIVVVSGGNREVVFANQVGRDLLMGRSPSSLPLTDEAGSMLEAANHPFGSMPVGGPPRLYATVDAAKRRRHYEIGSILVEGEDGEVEIVYTITDETARIETEKALERSHRREAIGTLTAGVAHDFNNMLTPIVGGLDIARRDEGLSENAARAIDRAVQATTRASTLVHRLLAFSRQQALEPQKVDLRELVEGAWDLFGRKLGPGIETFVNVKNNVTVEIDPSQLELAILNLMANSRDAMPEGGELTITVDETIVDEGGDLKPGRYGRIVVTDNGSGMPEEVLRHAVEPFFTTRTGQGSGLGLSMVDGLAAQSGGRLDIHSAPRQGTRVDIWLPAVDATQAAGDEEDAPIQTARPSTILLVDDEALVRGATADMLRDIGHTVIEASSGAEAIATLRREESIDAIVADHLMPGMTGGSMAHEIWDFRADMRILLISGYAQPDALPSDMPRLAKPFRRNDLAKAVEELLARPAAGS